MFPVVRWLPAYRRDWWRADPVGGLTAAAVVIPKAMALWGSDMRDCKAPGDAALLGVPYGKASQQQNSMNAIAVALCCCCF